MVSNKCANRYSTIKPMEKKAVEGSADLKQYNIVDTINNPSFKIILID